MNIGKRLILLAIYMAIGFVVLWFFIAGGEGSASPIYMFCSWGFVFARIFGHKGAYLFLVFIPAYFACLIYLNSFFAKIAKSPIPLATGSIHAIGCIIGAIIIEPQPNSEADATWKILSVIVSAVAVLFYLELDWTLARGGMQPTPKGPYWDLGSS